MTGKRFEVVMNEFDEVEYIMDKAMMEDRDFAEFMDFVEDTCKENEELKSSDTIIDLETEIMNLKTTIQQLRTDNTKQKKKLNTTMKENEQLKSENKKLNERIGILEGSLIDKGFDIND